MPGSHHFKKKHHNGSCNTEQGFHVLVLQKAASIDLLT